MKADLDDATEKIANTAKQIQQQIEFVTQREQQWLATEEKMKQNAALAKTKVSYLYSKSKRGLV